MIIALFETKVTIQLSRRAGFLLTLEIFIVAEHKSHVYQQLAEVVGVSVNKLEAELDVSNGAIRKAIDRDSDVSAQIAERIVSKWPDVSLSWLIYGWRKGEALPKLIEQKKSSKATPLSGVSEDWQSKYLQSLERNNDALLKLAETKADNASLRAVSERLELLAAGVQAQLEWSAKHFSRALPDQSPDALMADWGTIADAEIKRRKNTSVYENT